MVNKIVQSSSDCPACRGKSIVYVWQKSRVKTGVSSPQTLPCGCAAHEKPSSRPKKTTSLDSFKRFFLLD